MMNPDSVARFGARPQSNLLTPHFGQANPNMLRGMAFNPVKPGIQIGRMQPAAAKTGGNTVLMASLLGVAALAAVAFRNTVKMAPMLKKALAENNKNVDNAIKTTPWGYAKDGVLGVLGLTGSGFGIYGTIAANEAKKLAKSADTEVGTFDTRIENAEYGLGEIAYRTLPLVAAHHKVPAGNVSDVLQNAANHFRATKDSRPAAQPYVEPA